MFTAIFVVIAGAIACAAMVVYGMSTWVAAAIFMAALAVGLAIDKVIESRRAARDRLASRDD